jgi:enamine deaminase RidA (YjgF/YER057c/UK114 family)
MIRVLPLLAASLLAACAMQPPVPPPPPPPPTEFIVPVGTEFVSDLFGYSQAARTGPWIEVSAQPGFDVQKRGFPEDFGQQVQAAFHNLDLVLRAAGAQLTDVVQITTYQLDMSKFNDVVDVRNEVFGEHRPAWTAVGVKELPLPSMQFQISARAYTLKPLETPDKAPTQEPAANKPKTPPRFMNRPGY